MATELEKALDTLLKYKSPEASGPKPDLYLHLPEWSVTCLIGIAEAMRLDRGQESDAYLHLKAYLAHKGVQI